jgi:RNAse (barnase) inhibitor barstar
MLCQTYFERYSRELNTQWDSLESKTSLPVDPNTQKEKMKEIYDLLKK